MGTSSSMSVLPVLILLVIVGLVVIALLPRLLLTRRKPFKDPVCGFCRYTVAPNPNGLSICPECGKDYLVVGILAPGTKLPTRMPGLVMPVIWIVLCMAGGIFAYKGLYPVFLKNVTTSAFNEVTTVPVQDGLLKDVPVTFDTLNESVGPTTGNAGASNVLGSTLGVQLAPKRGNALAFTVNARTGEITSSDVPGLGTKGKWDAAAAKAVVAALAAQGDSPAADGDDTQLLDAVNQRIDSAKNPASAGPGVMAFSSFSSGTTMSIGSMSGSTPSVRTRNRLTSPTLFSRSSMTSMRSSSSVTPEVFIGPLRGKGWLMALTGGGAGLLATIGLVWIAVLNRRSP